jgi:hypothetical protein
VVTQLPLASASGCEGSGRWWASAQSTLIELYFFGLKPGTYSHDPFHQLKLEAIDKNIYPVDDLSRKSYQYLMRTFLVNDGLRNNSRQSNQLPLALASGCEGSGY